MDLQSEVHQSWLHPLTLLKMLKSQLKSSG